jgi:hypothetical protein
MSFGSLVTGEPDQSRLRRSLAHPPWAFRA